MEIKKVLTPRIVLDLTWEEAKWLAEYIRNAIVDPNAEPEVDRANRLELYTKLKDTL